MNEIPAWDVLIPTIPHRHAKLCQLLGEFDRQRQPGFGVLVLRDNLERPGLASHGKRQDLTEASRAEYVCFVDDDDWVAPDYVSRIQAALASRPDYVGFTVDFLENGQRHYTRVEHSLKHGGWRAEGSLLLRDVSHLNPMRRELALCVSWVHDGGIYTDDDWTAKMREAGVLRTEEWIEGDMYHYRRDTVYDGFWTPRTPMSEPLPELPSYPWLTVL